ncbi:SDR family NAD(P)-dependent oxidoreductase [Nocardioides mesophilus]|uniref:SDR family oxidoreductase n=1 Tax=Nocardioides mesophilus TaxID=433659 RepID=A0A7G9R833_9ACTN|nr:SDR family oxidoreductase [Nocardioides mesophilus]QNN51758.1 SDR family oxidoreductase [Nocardioides mesophilus]
MAPTALVTGPTAGIGTCFAEQLAARGHGLVLVARDETRLRELAGRLGQEYGVAVEVLVADLSDRKQLRRVEARLAEPSRPVDLLVNNAGFGLKRPFLDNSVEDEQDMLDVLVTAVMRLSHAALGAMVGRGHGAIVNVSSVAGFLPRGTYSAAKAYVTSFSQWADLTYREQGVRTMALCPGFTKTEFHARMDVSRGSAPAWMWLEADRLVRDALADLERGKRVSVPSRRYQALTALARYVPPSLLGRLQGVGRR